MAEFKTFYQKVALYDIVFNRDVRAEVDFLLSAAANRLGRQPDSALEIACGPAYHPREIARRGIRAIGLDLMEEMIEIARQKNLDEGIHVELFAADMRAFTLDEPVDLIFNIFDSIDALSTNEDYIEHLRCVADNLTPKGIYIIEQTHPRDISVANYGDFRYSGESNGKKVDVRWAVNKPVMDVVSQLSQVEIEIRIEEDGVEEIVHDTATERYMTPNEIRLLAQISGKFTVTDWYGDYRLDQPLDNTANSRKMITVLQKI
jgi:ubiquinone/menaquinone biosynthesis C-methylase UbiE